MNICPAPPPIIKMFTQRVPDSPVVWFLADHRDYRFAYGAGQLLDVDEVEATEGYATKHHNVISELFQQFEQNLEPVNSIELDWGEPQVYYACAFQEYRD